MQKEMKLRWLFLGSLITNTGISFIWPLTTIYMHETLGESLKVSGMVLLVNSLFMIAGNYLGGYLFDRWRRYFTILIGIALNVFASGMLILFHGWPAYPIFLVMIGFGSGIVATCINSYATIVKKRQPSFVFNVLYFMSNLGLVIGTLVVGYVLPFGITYIFELAFTMFSIFFIVASIFYRTQESGSRRVARTSKDDAVRVPWHNTVRIFLLLTTLLVTWLTYEQWQSNISTYMIQLKLTIKDYSFLWTVNAALIVLFQPILTYFDDFLLHHLRGRLYVGFVLFASAFTILLFGHHYAYFIISMIVLTLGEILALPAVSTFVNQLAPKTQKGRYQGFVNVFASGGRAFGPLLGAFIIEASSYRLLFILCSIGIVISILIFALFNARFARNETQTETDVTANE